MNDFVHWRMQDGRFLRAVRFAAGVIAVLGCFHPAAAQEAPSRVLVEGRPVSLIAGLAQERDGRPFVPLLPVTDALRDTLEIDSAAQTIRVRLSHTGETRTFVRATGEVRRDGVVLATLPDASQVAISLRPETQQLPVDVLSFLLDVTVQVQPTDRTISIRRQTQFAQSPQANGRLPIQINRVDYYETAGIQGSDYGHSFRIGSVSQVYDGRLTTSTEFTGGSGQKAMNFLGGFATLERPSGQTWTGGDFALGRTDRLISAPARGFSLDQPFGSHRLSLFGGAALSAAKIGAGAFTERFYGTGVFGLLWANRALLSGGHGLGYEVGALHFSGADRRGSLFLTQISLRTRLNQIFISSGMGSFRAGRAAQAKSGSDFGVDVTDSLSLRKQTFIFSGSHFGNLFETPQINDAFRGRSVLSAAWAGPLFRGLNAGASAAHTIVRVGQPQTTDTYSWSAAYSHRAAWLPDISALQTMARSATGQPFDNLQVSLTRSLRRWRPMATYNRLTLPGKKVESASLGTSLSFERIGNVQFFGTASTGGVNSGTVDWSLRTIWHGKMQWTVGAGYARNPAEQTGGPPQFHFLSRFGFWLRLPHQHSLQINFQDNGFRKEFRINLGGAIFSRSAEASFAPAGQALYALPGRITGRLYKDVNLNGHFDPGTDIPLPHTHLWLDNSIFAETDDQGVYHFPAVYGGPHRVRVDLTTVPADLSPLNELDHKLDVPARVDMVLDFSFTQTGAVLGTVFYDTNGNGQMDPGENPASDIRILCSCGQETLTTVDGLFILTDIQPGEIFLTPDLKGLPQYFVSAPKRLRAVVVPGKRTGRLLIALQPAERPVEEQAAPDILIPSIPAQARQPKASTQSN